jgi:hypothetical protein
LGHGKGHLPAKEYIRMDRLIPILTHLSSHWTVSLGFKTPISYFQYFLTNLFT